MLIHQREFATNLQEARKRQSMAPGRGSCFRHRMTAHAHGDARVVIVRPERAGGTVQAALRRRTDAQSYMDPRLVGGMTSLRSIAQTFLVFLGGAALIIMMLHITAEVILRSAFNITIPGTLEMVTYYYMVFAVFAGLAIVALLNEQVIVEIFLGWMPRRALLIVDGLAALLGAGYAALLVYGGWLEAKSATRFGEMVPVRGFDVPIWPSRWVAVIGLSLIVLASLAHAIMLLRGRQVSKS